MSKASKKSNKSKKVEKFKYFVTMAFETKGEKSLEDFDEVFLNKEFGDFKVLEVESIEDEMTFDDGYGSNDENLYKDGENSDSSDDTEEEDEGEDDPEEPY